jgi:hypothetical protein
LCGKDIVKRYPRKKIDSILDDDFYKTNGELYAFNGGHTTACRDCVDGLFDKYIKIFGNKMDAFYCICAKLDIYFNEARFHEAEKMSVEKEVRFFSAYNKALNRGNINNGDNEKMFADTLLEQYGTYRPDTSFDEDVPLDKHEMVQRWGAGLDDGEYGFLEEEYSRWAAIYNCGEKNLQTLVEEICQTKLTIRQKRAKNRNDSVDKEMKTLQDLMGSGNLKPMQETGANAAEQSTFGNFIKHIENDRPIPEPEDEFKDVDGIWKYVRIWFLGHMAKIFKRQGKYMDEYEREIAKYTVETPEFDGEGDDAFALDGVDEPEYVGDDGADGYGGGADGSGMDSDVAPEAGCG